MLGKIVSIVDNIAKVKLAIDIDNQANLVNIHAVFEDGYKRIVGEIINIDKEFAYIKIVGSIENNIFIPGFSKKPAFKSKVRIVTMEELALIFGPQQIEGTNRVYLGKSSIIFGLFFTDWLLLLSCRVVGGVLSIFYTI